jgi:sulfonate transport system substrate-binding protein
MKKWITALPIVMLLLTAVAAHAADKPKVIRLGSVGNAFGKPYASGIDGVVDAKNLLDEEFRNDGIKIERTYFKATGPGLNEAFAAGLLDFGSYGDLPTVVGKAGGLRTKYILSAGKGNNVYVIVTPESGITSIKGLKGRKVAVTKGTYLHLTLNRLLKANGLTEKDIKLVNLSTADAQAALAAGSVDAFAGLPRSPACRPGSGKTDLRYQKGS